jgi:H+/Cl- antiporter ClcA
MRSIIAPHPIRYVLRAGLESRVATAPSDTSTPAITPKAYLRLVLLGALIGIPAALVAALFLGVVHYLQHWLWEDVPRELGGSSPQWYLVLFVPAVGAALVYAARAFLPGDGGHSPLDGIGGAGAVPVSYAPSIALAALASLVCGAALGPEAPLIALGAIVGTAIGRFHRLDEQESAVTSTAGSFSAVSALFGGPVVAGVLMMEGAIGFGRAAMPILLPGFVAAALGYVVIIGFGDWGGLDVPGLAVPDLPPYDGTHVFDLTLAIVVGIVTALLVAVVFRAAVRVNAKEHTPDGKLLLPTLVAGGLVVGALALVADWLGADSQDVLFSGQNSIPALTAEDSTRIVVILVVAKALAYAVSLGAGFRGGPVFPAIFLGVGLAMLAVIWFDASPTWAVAAGAAAGMAASTRMLLTSMLLGSLLVGPAGADAISAAVLAAAAAWLVAQALARRADRAAAEPAG